ncbi:acyl-CoA dehydrogenase domain protein [Burkholderia sp. H160]|nr:acyl-CoA dehydrogenase domain protein [Burkholderia sp. H160]
MDQMLGDAFEQLLTGHCPPALIRRVEAGESAAELWLQIHESGFADALVPVESEGAGLCWRDVAELVLSCGRHALPLPFGQTLLARAELARHHSTVPTGSITVADKVRVEAGGAVVASNVPFGLTAEWVWLVADGSEWLMPVAQAERERSGGHGSLNADLRWANRPREAVPLASGVDLRAAGAALTAALMAGAMERAGELTISYANERVQFGRPIGKLQAIQQQLSLLCEQMYAARMAALIGLSSTDRRIDAFRAATAKSRAGESAVTVAAVSHGVHGAIGITEEYDLQLFTRRVHDWRRDYGSETWWNGLLGGALLDGAATPLEFVRCQVAPAA